MPILNEVIFTPSVPKFGIDAAALRIITIPLDDARNGVRLDITGTFLYAITASSKTASMDVAFEQQIQDTIPYAEGQFISGMRYSQIYITNTAQAGGYIKLMYGVETDIGLKIQNPNTQFTDITIIKKTTLQTINDVTLAAAAITLIAGASNNRQSLLVTNLSTNANYIRVGDFNTGPSRGTELAPGMTITLDVTDAVWGYCAAAQDVAVTSIND